MLKILVISLCTAMAVCLIIIAISMIFKVIFNDKNDEIEDFIMIFNVIFNDENDEIEDTIYEKKKEIQAKRKKIEEEK